MTATTEVSERPDDLSWEKALLRLQRSSRERPGRLPRRPTDEDEGSQRVELRRNEHLVCRVSLIDERFQPLLVLERFPRLAQGIAKADGSVEPGSAEAAGVLQLALNSL